MTIKIEMTEFNKTLLRRFAVNREADIIDSIEWVASGLTQVTTEEAFRLAREREVWMLYEDGTEALLDDFELESESGRYADKSKTYPEIDVIFVVEGNL